MYDDTTAQVATPKVDSHWLTATYENEGVSFDLGDMELLHHFTASTAPTLSTNSQLQRLWQDCIPRLALSADYVLLSILAISSLHLAYLRPQRRQFHWNRGIQLYQTALGKAKVEMEHLSEENCRDSVCVAVWTAVFGSQQHHFLGCSNTPHKYP
jgi:hypothetical protein